MPIRKRATRVTFTALIEAEIKKAGGLRRLATALGINASYLCDLRYGRRQPGPKMLKALGLRRVVTYEV